MILDNCPSELHSLLASKVSTSGNKVSLVTIEYDIRDDKPQTTEVIHIEAIGPGVAEQLLLRRFPCIGQNNAHRIAEFADGNARVSLAIAERVEEGESLAQLSDAQLFNRLFEQRNHSDENLREQAEILSLVYSFSVSAPDMGYSELEVLGRSRGIRKTNYLEQLRTCWIATSYRKDLIGGLFCPMLSRTSWLHQHLIVFRSSNSEPPLKPPAINVC